MPARPKPLFTKSINPLRQSIISPQIRSFPQNNENKHPLGLCWWRAGRCASTFRASLAQTRASLAPSDLLVFFLQGWAPLLFHLPRCGCQPWPRRLCRQTQHSQSQGRGNPNEQDRYYGRNQQLCHRAQYSQAPDFQGRTVANVSSVIEAGWINDWLRPTQLYLPANI